MLTLTQLQNGTISIKTDYYYKDRIKKIPSARFDFNTKEWIIDMSMLFELETEFDGELVYKTPRWVMLNEPMPNFEAMYEIHNKNIAVPNLKLNPYDYQNYGIKFMIDRILNRGFVLNADDVGLGKTLMTIGTLKWFIDNRNIKRILIISKKSIKSQWIEEINKVTNINQEFELIRTESLATKRKKAAL